MGKQIHTENGHQVGKRPVEFGPQLQKPKDQHRNQCCPNLDLDRIGTCSDKGLDLEVLLQRFEKQLNLPSIFIDSSNRGCSQGRMIGQENQNLIFYWVIDFNPS